VWGKRQRRRKISERGARISEVLGLQWRHVELDKRLIRIEQRLYHGEIGAPKTDRSRRTLTLGHMADRFRAEAKPALSPPR
jgi:integrase